MSFQCAACSQVVSDLFSQTCPSCGQPFSLEKAVRVEDPEPPPPPPDPEAVKRKVLHTFYACGLALLLTGGAVFAYYDLAEFERTGGRRYMPTLAIALYRLTGKEGVVCTGLLVPMLLVYGSVGQWFDWPFCSGSDTDGCRLPDSEE